MQLKTEKQELQLRLHDLDIAINKIQSQMVVDKVFSSNAEATSLDMTEKSDFWPYPRSGMTDKEKADYLENNHL